MRLIVDKERRGAPGAVNRRRLAISAFLVISIVLMCGSAALFMAVPVKAAGVNYYVDSTRPNDSGDGLTPGTAKKTIQAAIDAAGAGDVINVAAGTYSGNSQILVNKALTLKGAGPDSSLIDGSNSPLTEAGLIRITANNGNMVFTGFTVKKAGPGAGGVRVGIYASSNTAGPTYSISNNKIIGTGDPDDENDYGFYSNGGREALVFTGNTITATGANPVLIERHPGATNVSSNTLDEGCYGSTAYFNMTYGGDNISSLQKVSNNTIIMNTGGPSTTDTYKHAGVTFSSSFRNPGDPSLGDGQFTNVEVSGNTISGLGSYRTGITLVNGSDGGTGGLIDKPKVTGNIMPGLPSSVESGGILLKGLVKEADISGNNISATSQGFYGCKGMYGDHYPTGTAFRNNKVVGNTIGLQWDGPAGFDATSNYWGSDSGPANAHNTFNVGSQGNPVSDNVNFVPWRKTSMSGALFTPVTVGLNNLASIQAAIDAAGAGNVISVAAGTYTEDLKIPGTKANLEIKAASPTPTIKGVRNSLAGDPPGGEWPLARPGIEILASGVKVHGFTIESPDYAVGHYTSGTVIGAINVEIYDNAFKVTPAANADEISQAVQTYATADSSGLNVHNNTFTNLGGASGGYEGIYLNPDTGSGPMTVKNNVFNGQVCRAITTQHSNVVISGNSIVTNLAPNTSPATAPGWQGINVGNTTDVSDVSVSGNTVKGSAPGKGFGYGIRLRPNANLSNVTVTGNTVQMNTYGVQVTAGAGGAKVNQNDISGNTTGVQNDDTVTLDAENNWWGHISGPLHSSNPDGLGNLVSDNVDFAPWMLEPVPQVTAINPDWVAPNSVFVGLKLTGMGFKPGATVWLERDGGAPVLAAWTTVVSGSEAQSFFWGFIGAESGKYDVVLKNPDGLVGRLNNGFEIKAPPPPAPCGSGGAAGVIMLGFTLGFLSIAGSSSLRRRLMKKTE